MRISTPFNRSQRTLTESQIRMCEHVLYQPRRVPLMVTKLTLTVTYVLWMVVCAVETAVRSEIVSVEVTTSCEHRSDHMRACASSAFHDERLPQSILDLPSIPGREASELLYSTRYEGRYAHLLPSHHFIISFHQSREPK